MFRCGIALMIWVIAAATSVAQTTAVTCPGEPAFFQPGKPNSRDVISITGGTLPFCTRTFCLPLPKYIGQRVSIAGSDVTLEIFASDSPFPPQLGQTLAVSASQVGPLPPNVYVIKADLYQVAADGTVSFSGHCGGGDVAMMAVQDADAPLTIVPAVEFYNRLLDHYFVTASPAEISDLDGGVHFGWDRTGQSFNVFAAFKSGGIGTPVCRFYAPPSTGIDSHFFTAGYNECRYLPGRFNGVWQPEALDAFEIVLPANDSCPVGYVPVYRLWNGRADSNHRYTTDRGAAVAMSASGWILEGFGNLMANMCSPQ